MSCSAEMFVPATPAEPATLKPCAVKTLRYSTHKEQRMAEAEVDALWATHGLESVITCYGVFPDWTANGMCLQVVTE